MYEDLKRIKVNLHIIDNDFSLTNSEFLSKQEIVEKICDILKQGPLFYKLIAQLDGYTLMKYRVKEMRKFATKENKANAKIKNYINTISWHIQRMYRLRNDITHDSFVTNQDLTPFIEHLHDFLVTTIAEVVLMVKIDKIYDINQIFASDGVINSI